MKKFKLSAFLIAILCAFSISVSAETITDLGDCPIVSITLPDSTETATRATCSPKLLDMLKTTKPNLDQTMAAGNLYILSFGSDGKSIIQYTLSSQSNTTTSAGNINNLTPEQFDTFTEDIKSILSSYGNVQTEAASQMKLGEYSYLCLDGYTNDESNNSKLYFRTYATVQSDKLIMLRAMNYSKTEFDAEQKKALDSVAESIAYKKESVPAATEAVKTAPKTTAAPKQTEVVKQTQAPVTTEAAESTTAPQSTTAAPTNTPAAATEKVQSTETQKTDEAQETGNTFPVIGIISAIIIIAAAVIFIVIKKKKK